jgi:hypothetical protein
LSGVAGAGRRNQEVLVDGTAPGRLVLTVLAVVQAVGPWIADYNETHIFNPAWAAHAKFHVAQTLVLGTLSGLIALWLLWRRPRRSVLRWDGAAVFSSLYWATLLPAILVPQTAHVDPEFADRLPAIGAVTLNQTSIAAIWILVAAGAWWSGRRSVAQGPPSAAAGVRTSG